MRRHDERERSPHACELLDHDRVGQRVEPGTTLVDHQPEGDQLVLLVDTKGELPLGGLVRRLAAAGWLVVGVEPVADALEDAFRSAVLGAKATDETGTGTES